MSAADREHAGPAGERRLLILCYFYPPLAGGGVHRMLGFTRHLPKHGWACTVVCAGAEDYWVTDETLEVPAGTEVIRVAGGSALSAWLRLGRGRGSGRRSGRSFAGLRALSDWWLLPDSYAGWAGRAAAAAGRRIARGGIHALLSSSPPDSAHLAALSVRSRHRVPWIADFRDPWIGLHFRTPPTAWHRRRQEALERRVLEGADLVLTASRSHSDDLRQRVTAPREAWAPRSTSVTRPPLESPARLGLGRLHHLANGFEPARAAGLAEAGAGVGAEKAPAAGPPPDQTFTLVFTGTLSLMSDTGIFLEALHDLLARRPEARRRIRARLAGPFDTDYADRAVALGLTGIVEFLGPRPHSETLALQRRADLLLLWKPRGGGFHTMVPGKLYEYLDAGRPLLALLEPDEEAADLVRRAGGEVVPSGQREPLSQAIERRYLAWKEGARPVSARPDWLGEHSRERLAARLAGLLDGLTGGGA